MTNSFNVPTWLHDVFGEAQTALEVFVVLAFGLVMAAVWLAHSPELPGLPAWKLIAATLIAFDIFSGCVANFTRGTSDYYARRPRNRLVFIAVHVHLPLVAWLIGADLPTALLLWAYVIAAASVVNALIRHPLQRVAAAVLLSGAVAGAVLAGAGSAFTLAAVFFALKVIFGFGVDHYGAASR